MDQVSGFEKKLDSALKIAGIALSGFIAGFTIYTILMGQFTAQVQRGIFLLSAGLAIFCFKPFSKAWASSNKASLRWINRCVNFIFMGMLIFSVVYLLLNYFEIAAFREGLPNEWDLTCYTLGTISVLEAVRRSNGWPLLSVILATLIYLFLGHHLGGMFWHHKLGFPEIAEMSFGMSGVFGIALGVVANIVYIFIIYGAVLRASGAGELFIDLAFALTGRYPGGPAQTAVVASAFFGSINGSGPANVVSTGSFTIPLMIRSGFSRVFAASVEATASCVGQIMPPIMGVGAFIMSEITGIPYYKIMIAAVIPAILYSFSLLVNVRFKALLEGLKPVSESEIPRLTKKTMLKLTVLLISIIVLLYKIIIGQTPSMAGLSGIVALLIGSMFLREMRSTPKKLIKMLIEGGRDGLNLTIACAGIGIIIGGINMTGLGVKFSQAIIGIGGSSLAMALVMAALCCIIIGMGLPTAASYLMVVFIAAPAITKLGLPLLITHLFIFYYAVMSAISPPVALNAYAASGIAKSDPLKTAINAIRLGTVGFALPFLWVYNQELTLTCGSTLDKIWTIFSCALAIVALASANIGFLRKKLSFLERAILLVSAILMAMPKIELRMGGMVIFLTMYLKGKERKANG